MRLIDGDALLENVKRGVYTDDLSTTIAVDICKSHIEKMPTIDAIPVEWLREKIKEHTDEEGWQDYLANSFGLCIEEWQKEQVKKHAAR